MLTLLVGCATQSAQQPPMENRSATPQERRVAHAPSPSCRALVTRDYESGDRVYIDKSGNKVIVTESDTCGMLIDPVFFKRGSASVEPRQLDPAAGMFACLDKVERTRFAIEVVGHASSDEPDPESLGRSRAQAVADYFTACSVPLLSVTVRSAGAREPRSTTGTDLAHNRRVDLLVVERRDVP